MGSWIDGSFEFEAPEAGSRQGSPPGLNSPPFLSMPSDLPPPKVLVVDDNEQNRELARAALEDESIDVLVASSGEEAIALFERDRPDCVLLDVRMPGLDGFAVCERIRKLDGGSDTPIIFLTALRDIETFDRALRAGGDDFLTKPVRPTELIVRVQGALKLRRLGAELRHHYDVIRRQRDDMMRLQLQKERLTSFVVHDLKNPVNAMDLHAQMLYRDRGLSASARESAASIRAEARHLMLLITNLLDISKSEEGQLVAHVAHVAWRPLVEKIFEEFGARAEARRIELQSTLIVDTIEADRDLLQRVLENLFENALRHAPMGSAVRISDRLVDGEVEIRLADSGSGVPVGERERIFDRFAQVEGPSGSRSGRGLGLTFCKSAIEAHGGRIWVEDADPGAVFCVRLRHGS
jgi:two-component system sensor histidine kinase/response regulator